MNTVIFLLIITCYQPDVMVVYLGEPLDTREKIIVSSPEAAAVIMWQKNQFPRFNSSYSGELYRIDLEKGTIEKVKIPTVKFMEEPK